MDIRIAGVENDSIVDGPGIRMTIFTQGCPHNCKGCHNPQTHDYNGGTLTTTQELLEKALGNPLLDGVTFSGGEPFAQAKALYTLGVELRKNKLNIMTYSGYTFEELLEKATPDNYFKELLEVSDILVDGRYIDEKRSLLLLFRGSTNQRLVNVQESLKSGKVIEMDL